jgi:sorbitol-specific phosphotransferase system component IIA
MDGFEGVEMSECIHCQIHDLLESHLQNQEVNLGEIAFKVTEVLADLVLMAPPEDQGRLIADILRNLGHLVLEKDGEAEAEGQPGRHRH